MYRILSDTCTYMYYLYTFIYNISRYLLLEAAMILDIIVIISRLSLLESI